MQIRVNKFPYFLWLNKDAEIKTTDEKNVIVYADRETDIKKVSIYEIFILKHIPMILLLIFTLNIPPLEHIAIGLVFFLVGLYIFVNHFEHLQKFFFLLMFIGWYLVWNDYEADIEQVLNVAVQLSFITLLCVDLYNLVKKDHYYYLKHIHTPVQMSGTRAFPWIVRKFSRFVPQAPVKVTWFNTIMSGFYIKLDKEL